MRRSTTPCQIRAVPAREPFNGRFPRIRQEEGYTLLDAHPPPYPYPSPYRSSYCTEGTTRGDTRAPTTAARTDGRAVDAPQVQAAPAEPPADHVLGRAAAEGGCRRKSVQEENDELLALFRAAHASGLDSSTHNPRAVLAYPLTCPGY